MKQIFINLWADIKIASKDTVDVSMVVLFLILAILDLNKFDLQGVVGFMLFYIVFLLIRKGGVQRKLNAIKKEK